MNKEKLVDGKRIEREIGWRQLWQQRRRRETNLAREGGSIGNEGGEERLGVNFGFPNGYELYLYVLILNYILVLIK